MAFWHRWLGAEQKSAVPAPVSGTFMAPYMSLLSPQEITPYQAWLFYMNVAPFAKVVDLIADEAARLVPLVEIDGKPISNHPVTQFMRRPGFARNRTRLIKELAVQYLVTGNAYVHSIGEIARPPVALDVLKSSTVAPTVGHDMWPAEFLFSEGTRSIRFTRMPEAARDFRWIDMATGGLGEIHPIYDIDGNRRGIGVSRLNSIRHDVDMRLKGIVHNSATLENGARLSGVLSVKDGLTPDQRADLQGQIKAMMSGATNAGKILVTGGGEMDFTQMSQSAKDMDFANLIRLVEDAIVSRYNVPVSLFRTEAQTNNNYNVAWRQLYFTSVLPVFDVIWSGIAGFMSDRLGEPIDIVHDALTNPILAEHATSRSTTLFNAHLISRNEARQMVGYEPALGGDTIYGPMGEVPVGEDFFTGIDDANNRLTADAYHGQRPGSLPPERQPVAKPDKETEDKPESPGKTSDKLPDKKPVSAPVKDGDKGLRLVH